MGGEVGSNGAPSPSLEILPTPAGGPTWMFLDYLNRTDPNNLYPFLDILPSGRLFVGACLLSISQLIRLPSSHDVIPSNTNEYYGFR